MVGQGDHAEARPRDAEQWRTGTRSLLRSRRQLARGELIIWGLAFLPCVLAAIIVGPVVAEWTGRWLGAGAGLFVLCLAVIIPSRKVVVVGARMRSIDDLIEWVELLHGKGVAEFWDSPLRRECEAIIKQQG